MPSRMISPDEIRKILGTDQNSVDSSDEVMQCLLSMAEGNYTIIYNDESERFIAAEDNKPIPLYMHDFILSDGQKRCIPRAN